MEIKMIVIGRKLEPKDWQKIHQAARRFMDRHGLVYETKRELHYGQLLDNLGDVCFRDWQRGKYLRALWVRCLSRAVDERCEFICNDAVAITSD
jgi:hypothetical protein